VLRVATRRWVLANDTNMTQRAILKNTKLDMSLKCYSDYMDTFSPVSKKNSLSIMILDLHYIDVKTTLSGTVLT
jgi:hypothetical protein